MNISGYRHSAGYESARAWSVPPRPDAPAALGSDLVIETLDEFAAGSQSVCQACWADDLYLAPAAAGC